MTKQKPLTGFLMFLHFLFGQAVNRYDDYLYLRQASGLNERFQLVSRNGWQAEVLLFGVGHYSLAGITTHFSKLADQICSITLLPLTSSSTFTTSHLRVMGLKATKRVVGCLLVFAFISLLSLINLTMITLYSNKLYVCPPIIRGY